MQTLGKTIRNTVIVLILLAIAFFDLFRGLWTKLPGIAALLLIIVLVPWIIRSTYKLIKKSNEIDKENKALKKTLQQQVKK